MATTRRSLLSAAAVGWLTLAGCTGNGGESDDESDGGQSPTASSTTGETAGPTVAMANTAFDPVRLSVDPGTTVEWINRDGYGHDVTAAQFHDVAADWSFAETVEASERVSFTFDETGVYEYYCTIHGRETMCGVVLAGDATLDSPLPCEDGDGAY